MTTATNVATHAPARTAALPLLLAGFLGVFILGMVGFSHMSVAHNAGHDYRHSMAFPCH
jgi:cobalt transporter subunit CbtB